MNIIAPQIAAQMAQATSASYADQLADVLNRQRRAYYETYDFDLGNVMLDVANALANASFDFSYTSGHAVKGVELHQPVLDHIRWMLTDYIPGLNAEERAAYGLAESFAVQVYSRFE